MKITKDKVKKYLWNILIWIDQGFNVVFLAGDPDETISSRMGKLVRSGKCPFCYWICTHFLHKIDPNHCKKSIEEDEGENEIR